MSQKNIKSEHMNKLLSPQNKKFDLDLNPKTPQTPSVNPTRNNIKTLQAEKHDRSKRGRTLCSPERSGNGDAKSGQCCKGTVQS